jgi:hypothetical protein
VVERQRVGNRCLNTLILSLDINVDKNGDRTGPFRGSVEPSEGKDGESVVAFPRFSMW